MMHSVEFLDQAGNVVSGSRVNAPDDASAFRMVAKDWPRAAWCVRILAHDPAIAGPSRPSPRRSPGPASRAAARAPLSTAVTAVDESDPPSKPLPASRPARRP